MVINPAATFDYAATVPDTIADGCFECPMRLTDPQSERYGNRLVGWTPLMRVTDADAVLDAPPFGFRSAIALIASSPEQAYVAEARFHVDKELMRRLRPGDDIYLTRTFCAGLGMSVVRDGMLLVAIGAVAHMETGAGLTVKSGGALLREAEAALQRRDPEFRFTHSPVEMSASGRTCIMFDGWRELPPFEIEMAHGFLQGLPGTDESLAIWLKGDTMRNAARQSRPMLVPGSLELVPFSEKP